MSNAEARYSSGETEQLAGQLAQALEALRAVACDASWALNTNMMDEAIDRADGALMAWGAR